MKEITREWLEAASLDIEIILHIIKDDRLTGHVAFHSQQAIEKSLKALLEENGEKVPRIHSLRKLFELAVSHSTISLDEDIVIALDSLYIESRYPGELGFLPEGKPNLKEAQMFFDFAKEVYRAIKKELESKV